LTCRLTPFRTPVRGSSGAACLEGEPVLLRNSLLARFRALMAAVSDGPDMRYLWGVGTRLGGRLVVPVPSGHLHQKMRFSRGVYGLGKTCACLVHPTDGRLGGASADSESALTIPCTGPLRRPVDGSQPSTHFLQGGMPLNPQPPAPSDLPTGADEAVHALEPTPEPIAADAPPQPLPMAVVEERLRRCLTPEYRRSLYYFVLRRVGNPDEAEDLAQQALVEATQHI